MATHVQFSYEVQSGRGDAQYNPTVGVNARTLQNLYCPEVQDATDSFMKACIDSKERAKIRRDQIASLEAEERAAVMVQSTMEHEHDVRAMQVALIRLSGEVRNMAGEIFNRH